jgi:hypothetical protein
LSSLPSSSKNSRRNVSAPSFRCDSPVSTGFTAIPVRMPSQPPRRFPEARWQRRSTGVVRQRESSAQAIGS